MGADLLHLKVNFKPTKENKHLEAKGSVSLNPQSLATSWYLLCVLDEYMVFLQFL